MALYIFIIVIGFILAVASTAFDHEDDKKVFLIIIGVFFIGIGCFLLGWDLGEEKGAKKMMKGKYEIRYEVDSNMNVTDTIIMFGK